MIVTRLRQYYAKIENTILTEEEMTLKQSIDSNLLQRFKFDKEVVNLLNFQLRKSHVLPDKERTDLLMAIILLNGLKDEHAEKVMTNILLQGKIPVSMELLNEISQVR